MAVFRLIREGRKVNDFIFNGFGFAYCNGRPPYRYGLVREDHGVRIYGGSNTSTILYECTGRAFDSISDWAEVQAIIEPIRERVTRLDVATDIDTSLSPDAFVGGGYSPRFKSNGRMESETGITCYIGSSSSDCFARVYRYSDPHPRSALLRVECVYRRDLARSAARAVISCGTIQEFAVAANRRFKWAHGIWRPEAITDVQIAATMANRDSAGTVYWLYKQVAPAIRSLLEAGGFDLTEWLLFVQGETSDPYT